MQFILATGVHSTQDNFHTVDILFNAKQNKINLKKAIFERGRAREVQWKMKAILLDFYKKKS